VVNETYRSINPVQLPMIILDLKLPTSESIEDQVDTSRSRVLKKRVS
jgi:hypothetical protein